MKILITGCSGFIGYHLASELLKSEKYIVHGIDNMNHYYDVKLKKNRLRNLKKFSDKFFFHKIDISNFNKLEKNCIKYKYDIIINLAAQAGVRYSITNPEGYVKNNLIGFFNILEISKKIKVKHLIFASTSSVYGNSKKFPLKETDNTDMPVSFYAATKKSNEVMAYSYSYLYNIPITGLRFFTVFGPYGRPDMALFKFTKSMILSKKIQLFNYGNHIRDFTYISNITSSISKLIRKPPKNKIPYEILNIGSSNPKSLKYFLRLIENKLNKKSKTILLPMQRGDVYKTYASTEKLNAKIGYKNEISLKTGINDFINWFRSYYNK